MGEGVKVREREGGEKDKVGEERKRERGRRESEANATKIIRDIHYN